MKDTQSDTKVVRAITPAVKSASEDGATIDLTGFGSALIAISTGAIGGSGNYTAKVQETDGGSPTVWDDVAAGDLIGSLPAVLAADTTYRVGYRGAGAAIRVVLTKNSGTSIAVGAVAVLGHPHLAPVA